MRICKQLDRFWDRFLPAGKKDDRRDAFVLASALRTNPDGLCALDPVDAEIVQLREWSRMTDKLTAQARSSPIVSGSNSSVIIPNSLNWEILCPLHCLWTMYLIPTPAHARRIRRYSVANLLRPHRIRRLSAEQVLRILRSQPVHVAPGVTEATISHIQVLVQLLGSVEKHIRNVKCSMDTLIETLSASEDTPLACEDTQTETEAHSPVTDETASRPSRRLHDVEILSSLPGVGNVVLAMLLSEASSLFVHEIIPLCDVCAALHPLPPAPEKHGA